MRTILFFLFLLETTGLFSQSMEVRVCDIAFRNHIVRSINLKNESNEKLFGKENRLVQLLLDAVESKKLKVYSNHFLKDTISAEAFFEKIKNESPPDDKEITYYQPHQLYTLELGEDLIFDKNRSVIFFEIEYLTLLIPSRVNYRGILEPVATFKYSDYIQIFRQDERAKYIQISPRRIINYEEVFLMRLFSSYIVKTGSKESLYFDQVYNKRVEAFLATKESENSINEYVYKLFNPR